MKRQKQSREKLHREDAEESWLVRYTESQPIERRGKRFATITAELVWGKTHHDEGRMTVKGKTYHSLNGPTAKKSMKEYADRLNREKTPPSELKRCCADGSRIPKDGGKGQMMFSEYLQKPRFE